MPTAIFVPPMSTAPIIKLPLFSSLVTYAAVHRVSSSRLLGRALRQQAAVVTHHKRGQSKCLSIGPRKPGQLFRYKLRRNNVDHELPLARNLRQVEYEIAGICRQLLPD